MVDVPIDLPETEDPVDSLEQPEEIDISTSDVEDVSFGGTPKGHEFTIYEGEELVAAFATVLGAALVAYAIIWLIMRALDGDRRHG